MIPFTDYNDSKLSKVRLKNVSRMSVSYTRSSKKHPMSVQITMDGAERNKRHQNSQSKANQHDMNAYLEKMFQIEQAKLL